MWIAFYNEVGVGDVLMLTRRQADSIHLKTESVQDVTVVIDTANDNEPVAINVYNISHYFKPTGSGNIQLTDEQVTTVNQLINEAGFNVVVSQDPEAKFVVGYVESCQKHEDSDHLSVTTTNVGTHSLQIVCGAKNIAQGQHVLVARPGAVMPDGTIIWPGELRGVKSEGMICSTRELGLAEIEDLPGIWELDAKFEAGTTLETVIKALA